MAAEERRSPEPLPKDTERPCPTCKQPRPEANGAYYRDLRIRARVSLTEMARLCRCTATHLSLIERGLRSFRPRFVEAYESLFERRKTPTTPPGRSPRHGRI